MEITQVHSHTNFKEFLRLILIANLWLRINNIREVEWLQNVIFYTQACFFKAILSQAKAQIHDKAAGLRSLLRKKDTLHSVLQEEQVTEEGNH